MKFDILSLIDIDSFYLIIVFYLIITISQNFSQSLDESVLFQSLKFFQLSKFHYTQFFLDLYLCRMSQQITHFTE